MEEFEDAFLTSVDDQTTLVNKHASIPDYLVDNLNGIMKTNSSNQNTTTHSRL